MNLKDGVRIVDESVLDNARDAANELQEIAQSSGGKSPKLSDNSGTFHLAKEVSLGRVLGGVNPKKDRGWRLFLDLSFTFSHSVNGGTTKRNCHLLIAKCQLLFCHMFIRTRRTYGQSRHKKKRVPHNSSKSVRPSFTGHVLTRELLPGLGITIVWPPVSPGYF